MHGKNVLDDGDIERAFGFDQAVISRREVRIALEFVRGRFRLDAYRGGRGIAVAAGLRPAEHVHAVIVEELEELALGLAHEIRNPLASLRGAAAELVGGKLPEQQAGRMEEIVRRESDRLDRTVNGFLEYTRSRRLETPRPILVGAIVEEVSDSIGQRQDARGIEIVREMDSGIQILANPDEMHRVISNLAINAVEACAGEGRIVFRLSCREDFSVLEVCDDGVGMSPEIQARAFHPFYSTKPREGGLGLAIVRKIVVTSGGWIELDSAPGLGTTFRIGMPLASVIEAVDMKVGA